MAENQRVKCLAVMNCSLLLIDVLALLFLAKTASSCGYTTTDSSGEISSPFYPLHYPDNVDCLWKIIMPSSETVALVFEMFDIEPSASSRCEDDFVEIYDGSTSLGKYCSGNRPPRQITSSSNSLLVIFKSDNQTTPTYTGFIAAYASCGSYLTEPRGYLESPSYPKRFPDDIQCAWQIRVPEDYVVELRFDDFYMDGEFPCSLDYVKVRDGLNVSATQIGHYCATRNPSEKPIRSTGNTMWLEFSSFQESKSRGFKAHYVRVPHCGGFLETDYGRFSSPGYPGQRPIDNECEWIITVTEGKIVSLMFDSFDVDSRNVTLGHDCVSDYVEVYDGTDQSARLIGKFCTFSHNPPSRLRSSGRQMAVSLRTSFVNTGRGFLATYYGVDPSNYFVGCAEFAHQLLFTCDNGRKIHCQWKCDGTDDCHDGSDERHCAPTVPPTSKKSDDIRNYVIIILSITGSVLAIVCIGFIIDRLRRKRTTRTRRRRGQRRHHTRLTNVEGSLAEEPSSPPPPYELAVDESSCDYFGVSLCQSQCHTNSPPRGNSTNAESQNDRTTCQRQVHQGSGSPLIRTLQFNRAVSQSCAPQLESTLSESFVTSGLLHNVTREQNEIGTRDTSGNASSPSESNTSLNDTVPLIGRSSSTIEL